MAGRGRDAVIPAWMKQEQDSSEKHVGISRLDSGSYRESGAVDRSYERRDSRRSRDRSYSRDSRSRKTRMRSRSRSKRSRRSRSKKKKSHRSRHHRRSDSRSPGSTRHKHSKRSRRSRSNDSNRSSHRYEKRHRRKESRRDRSPSKSFSPQRYPSRRTKPTMWDIKPGDSRVENLLELDAVQGQAILNERTKHARRIYVGGVDCSERELRDFFLDTLYTVLGQQQASELGGSNMIVSVYVNAEKKYAFVEFNTVELTSAAQAFHGLIFRREPLKIRRPNDFDPLKVGPVGKIPHMVLERVGLNSSALELSCMIEGPNQVFVGGLPHHLTDEQVRELLEAFGKLKTLRVARDPGETLSKGYAFCEYINEGDTDVAIEGLNGLEIGDRILTVRKSDSSTSATLPLESPSGTTHTGMVPTPVLVLTNMVTEEEISDPEEYEDIVEDIREECANYGKLVSVIIPKPGSSGVGKVFVEFETAADSLNARMNIEGRTFSGRTVEIEFMELEKYIKREFY